MTARAYRHIRFHRTVVWPWLCATRRYPLPAYLRHVQGDWVRGVLP